MPSVNISNAAPWASRRQRREGPEETDLAGRRLSTAPARAVVASKWLMHRVPGRFARFRAIPIRRVGKAQAWQLSGGGRRAHAVEPIGARTAWAARKRSVRDSVRGCALSAVETGRNADGPSRRLHHPPALRRSALLPERSAHRLLDLAVAVWDLVDEHHLVGHHQLAILPRMNARISVADCSFLSTITSSGRSSLRMLHADDGGLCDLSDDGQAFRSIEIHSPPDDRRPVGDLHIAVAIDGGDVAGIEEAFVIRMRRRRSNRPWPRPRRAPRRPVLPSWGVDRHRRRFSSPAERRVPLLHLNVSRSCRSILHIPAAGPAGRAGSSRSSPGGRASTP